MAYRGKHKQGVFDDALANGGPAGISAARSIITGTDRDDVLIGSAGDDLFRPKLGYDTVDGGAGNDTLRVDYSRASTDPGTHVSSFYSDDAGLAGFLGGGFNPFCEFSAIESLRFRCWDGNDSVSASLLLLAPGARVEIDGGGGVNTLGLYAYAAQPGGPMIFAVDADGTAVSNMGTFINFQSFLLLGGNRNDDFATGAGNDEHYGRNGDDTLAGGGGNDRLYGDRGADTLAGGSGADLFGFRHIENFGVDRLERITDFSHAEGDKIDVSAINADKSVPHNRAFIFIGDDAFTGAGGASGDCALRTMATARSLFRAT